MKQLIKNTFAVCLMALCMGLCFSSGVKAELNTATVNVTPAKLILAVGETSRLRVSEGAITWSSSNPSVAQVSKEGVVKAMGTGSCVITAKLNKATDTCKVTVIEACMGHYSNFLKELQGSDSKTRYFCLVDMEQDDFPELVVASVAEQEVIYNVYTVNDREVKMLGFYVSSIGEKEAAPKVSYSGKYQSLMGDLTNEENTSHTLTLYKIKKNKLKINKQLHHYVEDGTLLEVYETGKKGKWVSEEEAVKYKKKYFSETTSLSMWENTAQNRKEVLGR